MILQCAIAALVASATLFIGAGDADAGALNDSEANNLIGGAVVLTMPMAQDADATGPGEGEVPGEPWNHSDWWAKCLADTGCSDTAEINNGIGCPYSYMRPGNAATICGSRTCVLGCANEVPAELCKDDWFWDCYYIDDPDALPDCGAGSTGTCAYSAFWHDGTGWVTCTIIGPGCTPNGGTIQCGTAHSCYSID